MTLPLEKRLDGKSIAFDGSRGMTREGVLGEGVLHSAILISIPAALGFRFFFHVIALLAQCYRSI